ncbi:MAG: hypothetical protein WA324_18020 [Bryobacteraceae bacterium]
MNTSLIAAAEAACIPLTLESRAEFETNYNRASFLLRHALHESELFSMSKLMDLAQRMSTIPNAVYYNVGSLGVGRGWDFGDDHSFSAREALDKIETSQAWMILRRVQRDPDYAAVLDNVLREVHQASRREYQRITHSHNISVILTSPNRITPYHFDADCNYLLQLHGSKTIHVFNGADRSVVTPRELERFYLGDINAAAYRPVLDEGASHYELTPGLGVHVPVTFPHWVQNHNNVSVSASINFCFNDETIPDLHRVNHYLRRARLNPRQPGQSRWADSAKGMTAKLLRAFGRGKRAPVESN